MKRGSCHEHKTKLQTQTQKKLKQHPKHKTTTIQKNTYKENVNNVNCTHFRIKFEGEHC